MCWAPNQRSTQSFRQEALRQVVAECKSAGLVALGDAGEIEKSQQGGHAGRGQQQAGIKPEQME